jgi:hypothetical protein
MATLPLKKIFDLLGTNEVAGSRKDLKILCIRIGELVDLNGEEWVKDNRQMLLDEWNYIVQHGIIT